MESQSWQLWQLIDSALPTGAFAHSFGLEAAHQHGLLGNLSVFIGGCLMNQAESALPVLQAMHQSDQVAIDFPVFDAHWDAFQANHVANAASRALGQAMLMTAANGFADQRLVKLDALRHEHFCHLVPVFGLITRLMAIDSMVVSDMLLFTTVRDLCSSAVRLGLIGPTQAQALQAQFASTRASMLELAAGRDWQQPTNAHPMQDHAQGLHENLYSRLFHS